MRALTMCPTRHSSRGSSSMWTRRIVPVQFWLSP